MVGKIVTHDSYGTGTVRASRHKGLELFIDFEDGLSRWVRCDEMQVGDVARDRTRVPQPAEHLPEDQFKARRMVEAFRLGIVPQDCVEEFTFGRTEELKRIRDWFSDSDESTLLVIGEYGSGKTHLLRFAYEEALRSGYACAFAIMDPDQAPFFKPKRVYASLMQSLRYYDNEQQHIGGFRELVERCLKHPEFGQHAYWGQIKDRCPDDFLWNWISGREIATRPWNPVTGSVFKKLPGLYDYGTAANIYCNLLSSLGWGARNIAGSKGLLLFFDEAEAIDRYFYAYQPQQGRNFLSALIRTAGDEKVLLNHPRSSSLQYCRVGSGSPLPFLHKVPSSLRLVFSFTPGYTLARLPELASPQGIELDSLSDAALGEALAELMGTYQRAYAQDASELRLDQILPAISLQDGRTRQFIKTSVEAFDLLRIHYDMGMDEVLQ
ncbi:BREX system ATP-binding domain-containing protein [Thermodesulfobacteriota bacterium]